MVFHFLLGQFVCIFRFYVSWTLFRIIIFKFLDLLENICSILSVTYLFFLNRSGCFQLAMLYLAWFLHLVIFVVIKLLPVLVKKNHTYCANPSLSNPIKATSCILWDRKFHNLSRSFDFNINQIIFLILYMLNIHSQLAYAFRCFPSNIL